MGQPEVRRNVIDHFDRSGIETMMGEHLRGDPLRGLKPLADEALADRAASSATWSSSGPRTWVTALPNTWPMEGMASEIRRPPEASTSKMRLDTKPYSRMDSQ